MAVDNEKCENNRYNSRFVNTSGQEYSRPVHQFRLVPKSGKVDGVPTWKCIFCNKEIKST